MNEKKYLKRKEKASAECNWEQLAICCSHLGDFYNQEGRYQEAASEYLHTAELYGKIGNKLEMAKAQRMIGEMYMLLAEFDKAKEHISIYLHTVKKQGNKVEEQRAYATLGRAHLLHGQAVADTPSEKTQLKEAEKAFLKSLLLVKDLTGKISKLEQFDMQARCFLNIGVVKEQMNCLDDAVHYIDKAIETSKSHDIFEVSHMCYISISLLYHIKKKDATKALGYCNSAIEVAKRLPDKVKKICETLTIKAEILISAGDFASAKQVLTKAYKKNSTDEHIHNTIKKYLKIVVKICQILDELVTTNSTDYVKRRDLFEKLGDGCCLLENYTKATEYYKKMLESAEWNGESGKSLIPIYISLYQTYKDNKEYDKALEYLWKEYEFHKNAEPTEAFDTLCSIAELYELQMQSFWSIKDIYEKAKQHAVEAGTTGHKLEKLVYIKLKKLHLKFNMNVLAEELINEANEKGIDLRNDMNGESDSESEAASNDNKTPDWIDNVSIDNLTHSETSDLDETEMQRPHRLTRGIRKFTITRNSKGETQLHQACISGNIELAHHLINQGHAVNVRDYAGWLPLHEACNHGFYDLVELLLNRGALNSINDKGGTSCDGITPLYDACVNGFLNIIELLLDHGADATLKNDFGETCVTGLDKWRKTVTLTDDKQAQYELLRERLLKPFTKVGISSSQISRPLKNVDLLVSASLNRTNANNNNTNDIIDKNVDRLSYNSSKTKEYKNKGNQENSARAEYKDVMEQLRRPIRQQSLDNADIISKIGSNPDKHKRSAYVDDDDDEDADENSWLIDDIGCPERKKFRFQTSSVKLKQLNSLIHCSTIKEANPKKISSPPSIQCGNMNIKLKSGLNSNSKYLKNKLNKSKCASSRSKVNSNRKRRPSPSQASLLDNGFYRFRAESPFINQNEDENEDSNDSIISTTPQTVIDDSSNNSNTNTFLSPMVSFKVKVENELLLVPVEKKKVNQFTIRWLAEEAARRYYNLVGLKPTLRLKTSDGFAYEDNDPISVAMDNNISASVLEWKMPSLDQRYEEMCRQLNKVIDIDIRDKFQKGQTSNCLEFSGLWLNSTSTEHIFRSILHQSNLQELDLSNNFIQNEGCRQLAKSLGTLKQLKLLNLKGNCITSSGLEVLLSGDDGLRKLQNLEVLILSQNPLGNMAIRILDTFFHNFNGTVFHKLHLSNCNITQINDFDLNFNQLKDFDISFNNIGEESLRKFLPKLNGNCLQNLNLNYCMRCEDNEHLNNIEETPISQILTDYFEHTTCEQLKSIELAGCHLTDISIYKLGHCLTKASNLQYINMTDNPRLSSTSFHFLLENIPQLLKVVAINCNELLDDSCINDLRQKSSIPNFMILSGNSDLVDLLFDCWKYHWDNKAKMKLFKNHLILYTNDKDLNEY